MYRATAPVLGAPRRARRSPIPLRLGAVLRREFGAGSCRIDVPELHRYFADLTNGHDVGHRRELVERAAGNTFISMARDLLDGRLPAGEPIDLAIVAHATPDFDPRLSTPVNLTAVLPGGPLVFSVSGQGVAAAFTALRVASGYVARHGYRRVLVLVMDQREMPYQADRPVRDAAVALLLEPGGGALEVGTVPGVAPAEVPGALADLLRDAAEPATVVAGPGIVWPGGAAVPDGFPCTGIWAPLAGARAPRPVVLADYDPVYRDLNVCVVREPAGGPDVL
ncbi:hypothetical protein [Amycolatopsis anabasis]|uniref:hypothetical protein n=1 Tax=Amycolatopsis anabasis TaxID=1840409 RepID=UPI00131B2A97|nr:hypothetical protein [Amycolatopsis anabasis]